MSDAGKDPEARSLFLTTQWSVVMTAKDNASPDAAAAMEALCRAYWYPLYALIRRLGHSHHDAEDFTQEFFCRLLAKDYLRAAAQEKGRFRTFLRVALKRFLANEWDRSRRLKRGGGRTGWSLDTSAGEIRYQNEQASALSPDHLYEQRWAMTLLEQVLTRLRGEHQTAGKTPEFEQLKGVLMAERGGIPYGQLASALGLSEGAARVAVHRLRKRFRELFRAAVADTVSSPEELEDELRYVVGVLGQR